MPRFSTLTQLLSNFISGVCFVPVILFFFYFISPSHEFSSALKDVKYLYASEPVRDNLVVASSIFVFSSLVLGIVTDVFAHLLVDDWFLEVILKKTRKDLVPQYLKREFLSITNTMENDFDGAVEACFTGSAPPHILEYRSEQWSYYEIYRNLFFLSILYSLISAFVICGICDSAGSTCPWPDSLPYLMISALFILFGVGMWCSMFWTLKYYYRVEICFSVGWLKRETNYNIKAFPGNDHDSR